MVYSIVMNASLLLLSLFIGLYTLARHTDFPRGLNEDEIENYRAVARNHSKKVRGCALAAIVLSVVFYALVPALCILFNVDYTIICICSVLFSIVQMSAIQIVFTVMSKKFNV